MPNPDALAWLRTTAESEDTTTAGHARAVLEMVEGLERDAAHWRMVRGMLAGRGLLADKDDIAAMDFDATAYIADGANDSARLDWLEAKAREGEYPAFPVTGATTHVEFGPLGESIGAGSGSTLREAMDSAMYEWPAVSAAPAPLPPVLGRRP